MRQMRVVNVLIVVATLCSAVSGHKSVKNAPTGGRHINNKGQHRTGQARILSTDLTIAQGPRVIINELYASHGEEFEASNSSWVELRNLESTDMNLAGWGLSSDPELTDMLTFPDVTIQAGGYLLITEKPAGNDSSVASTVLNTGLKIEKSKHPLLLLRADQSVASVVAPVVPKQLVNVSFGLPDPAATGVTVKPSSSALRGYTYLATPTPGAPNSGAAAMGPIICSVTQHLIPQPAVGSPITVNISVLQNLNDVAEVTLVYRVGFNPEATLPARLLQPAAPSGAEGLLYQVQIPASIFTAGDMVRWYATAKDTAGYEFRKPHTSSMNDSQYYGTVVGPPVDSTVAVLEWFTEHPQESLTETGAQGCVFFDGRLYDNVNIRRRGMSSLSWPKPKLRVSMPKSSKFHYMDDRPPVKSFGLDSFYFELGERSYMKEMLGMQVLEKAGVLVPSTFYVHVRQNKNTFGLFGFIEELDDTWLKRHYLSTHGPLIKSVSGELSNLRWDLPVDQMRYYYTKENRKLHDEDWLLLQSFTWGLAGGGPLPRCKYTMDNLDLPEVINEMAAQTLLNNQDRCTKNFFVYHNPRNDLWYRFAWDMDGSFGQDNGYGGQPGPNYCVLACEQWNSPLYCDSEHMQDLEKMTPWGLAIVPQIPAAAPAPTSPHRRSLLASSLGGPAMVTHPAPVGWDNPDLNLTTTPSKTGAAGTYNWLTDALLDCSTTRSMYLRRLRTLADMFYGSGLLLQMANETYYQIRDLAEEDARIWKTGIIPERGYLQITTEFIPTRMNQLINIYGPNGSYPLVPAPQPDSAQVYIKGFTPDPNPLWQYIEITNPNPYAVDMSMWSLQGSTQYTFPQGSVLPSAMTLYMALSPTDFRQRTNGPRAGQGLIVLGPLESAVQTGGSNATLTLVNNLGATVDSLKLAQ